MVFSKKERGGRLSDSPMMAHLLKALQAGVDIGDYGRLAFIIIARYFLPEEEIVSCLTGQPHLDRERALRLVRRVGREGYHPPTREQILEWQAIQEFEICPDPEDAESCDIYRQLRFPRQVVSAVNAQRMDPVRN